MRKRQVMQLQANRLLTNPHKAPQRKPAGATAEDREAARKAVIEERNKK
jgi:hypothetical protein